MDPSWLNDLGLMIRKGIVPTVLLLNPSAFGGTDNPDAIQSQLLNMNIKHYNFNDSFQDLSQFDPLGQEYQPGNEMRKYVKTLNKPSLGWRSLE
jgi:hypothetical protein